MISLITSLFPAALDFGRRYLTLGLVILLAALSVYAFYQKTRHASIALEMAAYKAQVKALSEMQTLKNRLIAEQTIKSLKLIIKQRDERIKKLGLDREKLTNELRGYYDQTENFDFRLNAMRERMRAQPAAGAAVSGVSKAPEGITEGARNGDRAHIATLEQACALTTLDYNTLREAWDSACELHACE